MTILTKPFSEKEKLVTSLEVDPEIGEMPTEETAARPANVTNTHPRIIILPSQAQARRVSISTIVFLLMIATTVVSVGVIGGKIFYNEYMGVSRRMGENQLAQNQVQNDVWVPIPSDLTNVLREEGLKTFIRNHFQENFEIDAENKYEKIDVPDFRFGRSGRFIHDFNTNYTGIIDATGQRCFVMPLNRDMVLPPSSLFDLVHKMWEGYYEVNTEVVRDTMKVVTPPLKDTTKIGYYIIKECKQMPVYKLENYDGGIVKRSIDKASEMNFGLFAGEGIWQVNIVNIHDAIAYENSLEIE